MGRNENGKLQTEAAYHLRINQFSFCYGAQISPIWGFNVHCFFLLICLAPSISSPEL